MLKHTEGNNGQAPQVETLTDRHTLVSDIMEYESGQSSEDDTVAMFQRMINDGSVWRLQGSYGRAAMDLLRSGQCILGEKGHRDYYGNYVPSRTEVQPGTMGSVEYAARMEE